MVLWADIFTAIEAGAFLFVGIGSYHKMEFATIRIYLLRSTFHE